VRIDDFPPDAWVCEQHPHQPWPQPNPDEKDGQCAGPGMLRPPIAAALDGTRRRDDESPQAADLRTTHADRASECTEGS
jgi:hypothetical protein